MSTDNTTPEEGITIVISHQQSINPSVSEVLGTTLAVSDIIKKSVIETIVSTSDAI